MPPAVAHAMPPKFQALFLATGLTILCAACTTLDPGERVPDEHIVMVNFRGKPVDPTDDPVLGIGHYRQVEMGEFEQQLARVLGHIETFARGFAPAAPAPAVEPGLTDVSKAREQAESARVEQVVGARERGLEPSAELRTTRARVVVFIHGGLNTQAGSVARAVELHRKLLADGVYPVFVNWQSSLVSSYWDHLFLVRYGEEKPWQAWFTAPFVIAADLLRALGRAPMTLWNEITTALRTTSFLDTPTQRLSDRLAEDATANFQGVLDAEFPEVGRNPGSGPLVLARDIVLMLPHMVLGVLLDIGGTASWEELHRRTTLILEPEDSYRADALVEQPLAAVPRFFAELCDLQRELATQGIELQVDLIGHSMGCIIANLLLGTGGAQSPNGSAVRREANVAALPSFTNIVYMADADSVLSTERSVYAYLQRKGHERANFFMLSLNDRAEVAETAGFWFAPKGSLLVWIDHFFEATPSMPDQRMGKLANQLFSLHRIPEALRERVHVKSFRFESDHSNRNPVEHGDFTDGKFWRPEYFTPRKPAGAQ